jgi:hypothetical protein
MRECTGPAGRATELSLNEGRPAAATCFLEIFSLCTLQAGSVRSRCTPTSGARARQRANLRHAGDPPVSTESLADKASRVPWSSEAAQAPGPSKTFNSSRRRVRSKTNVSRACPPTFGTTLLGLTRTARPSVAPSHAVPPSDRGWTLSFGEPTGRHSLSALGASGHL